MSKQVLVPTESTELTVFSLILEFEGKLSPGSKLHSLCVLSSPTLFGICSCFYKGFVFWGSTLLAFGQTPLDSGCAYRKCAEFFFCSWEKKSLWKGIPSFKCFKGNLSNPLSGTLAGFMIKNGSITSCTFSTKQTNLIKNNLEDQWPWWEIFNFPKLTFLKTELAMALKWAKLLINGTSILIVILKLPNVFNTADQVVVQKALSDIVPPALLVAVAGYQIKLALQ